MNNHSKTLSVSYNTGYSFKDCLLKFKNRLAITYHITLFWLHKTVYDLNRQNDMFVQKFGNLVFDYMNGFFLAEDETDFSEDIEYGYVEESVELKDSYNKEALYYNKMIRYYNIIEKTLLLLFYWIINRFENITLKLWGKAFPAIDIKQLNLSEYSSNPRLDMNDFPVQVSKKVIAIVNAVKSTFIKRAPCYINHFTGIVRLLRKAVFTQNPLHFSISRNNFVISNMNVPP